MSTQPWRSPIFLYGPPGSGKSQAGWALARTLQLPFTDLDTEVEARSGLPIARLVAEQGEATFRQVEAQSLIELASTSGGRVIALGGGSLLHPASRATVEAHGPVVCLTARLETLTARLENSGDTRPLLAGDLSGKLADLLAARAEHYASFPLQVLTDGLYPEQVAWEVQVRLGRFLLPGFGNGCPAWLWPGALTACGDAAQSLGLKGPMALVSDENVAHFHLERVAEALRGAGFTVSEVVLPAGEAHKTVASVSRLWAEFVRAGLERASTVVALGGGVVSDLAGFAAATYLRGVNWIVLPTSLLAMADAAMGAKTGADLPEGKNLVGAFYPPRLILSDPAALDTLPRVELANGMAEVVKHGIVGDPRLFGLCAGGWDYVRDHWDEVLRRAIAVKVAIVREDPNEQGQRAALNLGHTVGHAVEKASDYQLRHGEAVAIGTVAETRLAERMGLAAPGLANEVQAAFTSLGLPVSLPAGLNRAAIHSAMQVDKKRLDGRLRFALPMAIGDVRVGMSVDPKLVERVLDEMVTVA